MNPQPTSGRALKSYLLLLILIFSSSFMAGILAPTSIRNEATEAFRFFAEHFQGLAGGALFFNILAQNVVASIMILISGILIGVIPILSMVSNGFILGVLYRHASEVSGYWKAALKVLPHGAFEIPALLIAASYGLWLGVVFTKRIGQRNREGAGGQVKHAVAIYFNIAIPLFVAAALVETVLIASMR